MEMDEQCGLNKRKNKRSYLDEPEYEKNAGPIFSLEGN